MRASVEAFMSAARSEPSEERIERRMVMCDDGKRCVKSAVLKVELRVVCSSVNLLRVTSY